MPLIAGIAPDGGLVRIIPAQAAGSGVRLIGGIGPNGEPIYLSPAQAAGSAARLVYNREAVKAGPAVKVAPGDGTTLTDKGLVVARIAQLNVIDLQGDVTLPGAVGSGQDCVLGAWQHGSFQPGQLPAGKCRVTEEGNYLVVRGRYFLDTEAGRETFYTLKGLITSPWSYGFTIAEADRGRFQGEFVRFLRKLVIIEASPVMTAAGIGTGTVQLASLAPTEIMLASAAAANERALLGLQGFRREARAVIGHDPTSGAPVYAGSAGGRK